ncbi:MAG: TetR/AcrR family transcriptional regulator [Streptosporangiaceae bacterium]|jgi:AcrR family transcriptional regulator
MASARSPRQRDPGRRDPGPRRDPARRRDPERRARILRAAADLASRRGFTTVSMADIGAEAGIVGSGIYRHFGSKASILVALLDQVMDRLMGRAAEIVATSADDRQCLSDLVRDHITVALMDRTILMVSHRESHTLAAEDRRRLRRQQRLYIEEWVHLLAPLRPDLADGELRLAVHAAIGAIQSTLFFRSGLAPDRMAGLLDTMAHGCLGIDPAPRRPAELTAVASS